MYCFCSKVQYPVFSSLVTEETECRYQLRSEAVSGSPISLVDMRPTTEQRMFNLMHSFLSCPHRESEYPCSTLAGTSGY